jgi:hypothetical protein
VPRKYPRILFSSTKLRLSRTGRDAAAWRIGVAQRSERDRLEPGHPRLKISLPAVRFLEVEEAAP